MAENAATRLSAISVGSIVGLIFGLLSSTVLGRFDPSTGTSLILTGALVGYLFELLIGFSDS